MQGFEQGWTLTTVIGTLYNCKEISPKSFEPQPSAAIYLVKFVLHIPGEVSINVVSGMTVVRPIAHLFIAIFDCG